MPLTTSSTFFLSKYCINILGMLVFLKNVTFYGVSPDSLLAETSEVKLKVQNEVQKGIDLGIVKPFGRNVLTGPCTREQAIKALQYITYLSKFLCVQNVYCFIFYL